jgi:sporulation protein YlmC with PRC-barrel domain
MMRMPIEYLIKAIDPAYRAPSSPPARPSRIRRLWRLDMSRSDASAIKAMRVTTPTGRHVGRVREVVVDLDQDRVTKATLSLTPEAAATLSSEEISVPWDRLVASNDDRLVLVGAQI